MILLARVLGFWFHIPRSVESWRFLESCEPHLVVNNGGCLQTDDERGIRNDLTFQGSKPNTSLGLTTAHGKQLADAYDSQINNTAFKKKKDQLFGRPAQPERSIIQVPGIPEVSDTWSEPTQWDW